MGSYIASDRSVAAARASGAQHRSMNPTQSLEKVADVFLSEAERAKQLNPPSLRRRVDRRGRALRNRRRRWRTRLAS